MMIQRWQTVWLLIASVFMVIFCFMPLFLVTNNPLSPDSIVAIEPAQMPVFMLVSLLTALLLFIAIFMFKNSSRQKSVIACAIFLILGTIIASFCIWFGWTDIAEPLAWSWGIFFELGAIAFALLAIIGIRHDENIIKSYDRIR